MEDRFTHKSRVGRGHISGGVRTLVYARDENTCQFCGKKLQESELSIDHLVPISLGGIDEIVNYVTCCRSCNQLKGSRPLSEFASDIKVEIAALPVHGDPVIDNPSLPIQIRLIRKRVIDKYRQGLLGSGSSAQKKIEKEYRRSFWQTDEGRALEAEYANLPGHVRIMIPEIRSIAKSVREYRLLVELAKSANTRNLIGSALTATTDIEEQVLSILDTTTDEALKKRIGFALARFRRKSEVD